MSGQMESKNRRKGDAVQIDGSYQYHALHDGPALQRAWHREKLMLFQQRFPVVAGESGLDVGCGSGVVTNALANMGCQMIGVDGNEEAVRFAQEMFERSGCQFHRALVDELDENDSLFDFAICFEVIEHLYSDQGSALIAAIKKRLKPSGRLCLTTPNYRGMWPALEWGMDKFSKAPKLDDDQHVSKYRAKSLASLLNNSGFIDVHIGTFCTFSPFVGIFGPSWQDRVAKLERTVNLPFGNLLAATASLP